MTKEGLIELEGDGRAHGVTPRLVCALFLGLIAATGLIDTFASRPPPRLLGREAANDRRRREEARLFDGSLARLFEDDTKVRSRVRGWVSDPWSLFLYRALAEGGDKLVVGKDGWLFLRERVVLDNPGHRSAETIAEQGAALLSTVERWLANHGVRLVVVPVPRKSVVCRKLLPRGVDPAPEIDEQLLQALRERGVTTVDLLAAFADERSEELFFRRGTHWTERAVAIAAREAARAAGILVPEAERSTRLRAVPIPPARQDTVLLNYMGLSREGAALLPVRVEDSRGIDVIDRDGNSVEPAAREGRRRIAVVGTSFTATFGFGELVAHFADEDVRVEARPGTFAMTSLARLFEEARDVGLPELVILEVPNSAVVHHRPLPRLAQVLSDIGLASSVPVLSTAAFHLAFDPGTATPLDTKRRMLARLPEGAAFHSGDGIVFVRLTGSVVGAPLEVELAPVEDARLTRASYAQVATWEAGRTELLLPIVAPARLDGSRLVVLVRSRASSEFTLDAVELRAPFAAKLPLELAPPRGDARLVQALAVPEEPRSAALIELEIQGPFPDGLLIRLADDTVLVPGRTVKRDSVLVLPLRPLLLESNGATTLVRDAFALR